MKHHIISQDPAVQAQYERMIARGENPRMAEMLALRQCPGIVTDTNGYGHSRQTLAKRFENDPRGLAALRAAARRRGYDPKPTDAYNETLADGLGDPEAFITNGEGEGHVKRVAEKRGLYRQPEKDPFEGAPRLADDLAETYAKRLQKEHPKATKADLKAEAVRLYGDKRK